MKKEIVVLLIGFFSYIPFANAQSNAINISLKQSEGLPHESVFVHFNTSLFLAGESLYYKVYCLNVETSKFSTLSKIAYVELIGEKHEVVFKHKIKLDSGIGFGDFTIPVSIFSGNYKLIAYTHWMQNVGEDYFFKRNISIINPFQSNQQTILVDSNDNAINQSKDSNSILNLKSIHQTQEIINSQFLEIAINRKKFKKRDQVSLTLRSIYEENIAGNYSISIRKISALDDLVDKAVSAKSFKNTLKSKTIILSEINYLPELRGELISGKLIRLSDNKPATNEKVSISIQEKDFILKVSNTNKEGIFYFSINNDYYSENAFLQVLDKKNGDYKITLNSHRPIDYSSLDFGKLKISSSFKSLLEERSIYNQIENGYFSLKKNTLKAIDVITPFFGDYFATFYLDDYTRFSKVKETFVEIITNAYIKRDTKHSFNFYVTSLNPYERDEKPAGVVVDGVLLQNFDEFLEYDSRKIIRISIARTETNFKLGSKTFGGFIVVETIDGNFYKELVKENITTVKLFKPQPLKEYYKKKYISNLETDRIPDFRNQLLWEPNVKMIGKEMNFNFFTSDIVGTYEICVEGFTANGNPVSIREFIIVE